MRSNIPFLIQGRCAEDRVGRSDVNCEQCGRALKPSAKFCPGCGAKAEGVAAAPSSGASTPPPPAFSTAEAPPPWLTSTAVGGSAASRGVPQGGKDTKTKPLLSTSSRERGGCLTVWLVLIIIINLAFAITMVSAKMPFVEPGAERYIQALVCVANLVFASAMLKWKAWGFYGLVAIQILNVIAGFIMKVPSITIAIWIGMLLLFLYLAKDTLSDLE